MILAVGVMVTVRRRAKPVAQVVRFEPTRGYLFVRCPNIDAVEYMQAQRAELRRWLNEGLPGAPVREVFLLLGGTR